MRFHVLMRIVIFALAAFVVPFSHVSDRQGKTWTCYGGVSCSSDAGQSGGCEYTNEKVDAGTKKKAIKTLVNRCEAAHNVGDDVWSCKNKSLECE